MLIKKKTNPIEEKKGELIELSLNAIKKYLVIDPSQLRDPKIATHILQQAKIGLQFEKEMNLNSRANTSHHIRIFRMTAENKRELKELIKKGLPQYSY